jgi:hypothetical protein
MVGYHWQDAWSNKRFEGLILNFGRYRSSKLTISQK